MKKDNEQTSIIYQKYDESRKSLAYEDAEEKSEREERKEAVNNDIRGVQNKNNKQSIWAKYVTNSDDEDNFYY